MYPNGGFGLVKFHSEADGRRRPYIWTHPHVWLIVDELPGTVLTYDGIERFQAIDHDGRFFVNPGSATGAWSSHFNG